MRDFTPDAVRQILTTDVPATYSLVGARDAPVAAGPAVADAYPVHVEIAERA